MDGCLLHILPFCVTNHLSGTMVVFFFTPGVHLYIYSVSGQEMKTRLYTYIYILCAYIYIVYPFMIGMRFCTYIYIMSFPGRENTTPIYISTSQKKRESFQVLSRADIYFSAPNTFWILMCSSQAVFITMQFCYAILNCINLFF